MASCRALAVGCAAEPLFESRQLTPSGEYTFGIEGPAVDRAGNLYVVNFRKPGTIGMLAGGRDARRNCSPRSRRAASATSIRFDRDGRMFVADWKKHNIFVVEPGASRAARLFPLRPFNQPNDIAVARDGTLYASDPHWKRREGRSGGSRAGRTAAASAR